MIADDLTQEDADFIAAARVAVPTLIARVRELHARIEERETASRADALRTALDGAVLMMGDGGITVYDDRDHYDSGSPRPLPIREWLERKATRLERGE